MSVSIKSSKRILTPSRTQLFIVTVFTISSPLSALINVFIVFIILQIQFCTPTSKRFVWIVRIGNSRDRGGKSPRFIDGFELIKFDRIVLKNVSSVRRCCRQLLKYVFLGRNICRLNNVLRMDTIAVIMYRRHPANCFTAQKFTERNRNGIVTRTDEEKRGPGCRRTFYDATPAHEMVF